MLRFISINFAVTIAAAPLAILLTFLLLYIVTHPKLRGQDGTKASKRPLTLTQHNTLLNRNENGGTGVWSRKWRRKVATALSMAPMRRGLGDLDEDDDESDEDDGGSSSDTWTLKADPAPPGLRGCLKRERSFEQVKQAVAQGETDESQLKLSLEPPSPSTSSASSASFYSPPLAPPSPDLSHRPAIATRKSVTIEEPCLAELEALRNLWDRPEMQSTVNISGNGGVGYGGIAGYRRTRDHYARGQGGRGINKSAVPAPVPAISPSPANPKAPRIEKTDDGSPRPRRPLNAAISSRSSSSSSLSPSPVMRRPIVKRAVSPGANTIVVGSASGRRRIPSPSNSSLATRTSSSISPAPTSERVQPRWIKSKKSPSRTSSTGSEKRVPPRPLDHDDDQDEENEEGGTGKNGTMSATVTDDEDGFEDEDVDDDRSVPPSRQGSSQAPPNITAKSTASSVTTSGSPLSPSLELLLDYTNRSLAGEQTRIDENMTRPSEVSSSIVSTNSLASVPAPIPKSPQVSRQLPTPSPSPSRKTLSRTEPKLAPVVSITPASPVNRRVSLPATPDLSPDNRCLTNMEPRPGRG